MAPIINPFNNLSKTKIQLPAVFVEIIQRSKFIKFIIALVCLGLVFGLISLFFRSEPKPEAETLKKEANLQPEQIMRPGEIGEIKEAADVSTSKIDEAFGPSGFPYVIFSAVGKVLDVKKDRIIVQGDGQNFADQKPRELAVIFTALTVIFEPGQKIKYQGLDGLKHLKSGMEIFIESEENIRGKTEFIARTVNMF